MRSRLSVVRTIGLAALIGVSGATLVAGRQSPPQEDGSARAIRELTAEMRSLRAAIERTGQTQLQGQILGLYLTLQQNRVTQATARLDTVRRELEGYKGHGREVAQNVERLETLLTQETDPVRRGAEEAELRAMKQESALVSAQEEQVRVREGEAYQSAQEEEQRWTELIGRLEQLLKK